MSRVFTDANRFKFMSINAAVIRFADNTVLSVDPTNPAGLAAQIDLKIATDVAFAEQVLEEFAPAELVPNAVPDAVTRPSDTPTAAIAGQSITSAVSDDPMAAPQ